MKLHETKESGVISLMVVLGVGMLGLAAALAIAIGVLTESVKNQHTAAGDQVLYASESAMNEGIYQFWSITDYSLYSGGPVAHLINQTTNGITTTVSLPPNLDNPTDTVLSFLITGKTDNGTTYRSVSRVLYIHVINGTGFQPPTIGIWDEE